MAGPRVRHTMSTRRKRIGAVVKPSSSTNGQRTTRSIARRAVDSTGESSDDTSGNNSSGEEEGSIKLEPKEEEVEEEGFVKMEPKEEEVEEELIFKELEEEGFVKDEAEEVGLIKDEPEDDQDGGRSHPPLSAGPQGPILEAGNFIVTSIHHRPWGAGDHHTTVGVYPTESDARAAATRDFLRVERDADGWESEWRRLPRGDGILELRGWIEDGEDDIEKYTATVKRVQQQQQQQPRIAPTAAIRSATAAPKIKVVKPQHVYFVTTEQRKNNGEEDAPRSYACGTDLKSREIHGIYEKLDGANDAALDLYDGLKGYEGRVPQAGEFPTGMAEYWVTDLGRRTTYHINVRSRPLK